jgi:hypothetical protein
MQAGAIVLWIVGIILGLVVQYWIISSAVRRALQDHTIWRHTKWPEMKQKLDDGGMDKDGFPVSK